MKCPAALQTSLALSLLSFIGGCSSDNNDVGATTGGNASVVGGRSSVGGTSAKGGASSTGGTKSVGGSSAVGGSSVAASSTGGTATAGASTLGGASTTGGTTAATGGTLAVGGTSAAATGGTVATGGGTASTIGDTSAKPTGGASATGGTASGIGGTSATTTGGTLAMGGVAATGGTAANGGTSAGETGGSVAGGDSSTGGTAAGGDSSTGGTAAGGDSSTGGSAAGGDSSTGGTVAGGDSSTGGSATGGDSSTGGSATGGDSSTGGSATGGDSSTGGTTSLSNFVNFVKQANGTTTASMSGGTITVSATNTASGNAFSYNAQNYYYYGTNSNGFIALPTTMTGDFAATAVVNVTVENKANPASGIGLGITTGFQPTDEYAYILMRNSSNVINAMYVSAAGVVGAGSPSVSFTVGTPMQLTFSRSGANLTYGAGTVGGTPTTQTANIISYFTDGTTVYGGGAVYPTISFNNVNATITQFVVTDSNGATVFNSDTGTLVGN
jgi:hypothetical protein